MNKIKSRKFGILSSWLIVTVLLGIASTTFFFELYDVRSPIVRKQQMIISPISDRKEVPNKASFLPKVEVAYAEAPDTLSSSQESKVQEPNRTELQTLVLSYFPKEEHEAVIELIHRESTWNPHAINKSSGATGLFQALPWSKTGCDSTANIKCQAAWGAAYIKARYGTAQNAIAFHDKNNWY